MAKRLCLIVILSMCLLTVDDLTRAEELSPSPDSPLPPESHSSPSPPEADSLPPPASSPRPEPLPDSPPPPPPQPSTRPSSPVPAPSSDENSHKDSEPETEYFPSPRPSPAPEERKPDDVKASEDGDEFEKEEDSGGLSGLEKAGIAIGAIFGVGAIVMGAIVYKKRRDNLTRARYTYFQGEFL
ncbi:proline-rich family protein [Raphanus sativus]|uniref:Extensin-like n=1 Tax=Raphanus sativus TaxID=3726 RepID=A0A6J0M5R5_RAPSA|nr:extensin-like [Raphanus sativus]KAJ4903159.1 proline-rich family protein [Raphanus sativus]